MHKHVPVPMTWRWQKVTKTLNSIVQFKFIHATYLDLVTIVIGAVITSVPSYDSHLNNYTTLHYTSFCKGTPQCERSPKGVPLHDNRNTVIQIQVLRVGGDEQKKQLLGSGLTLICSIWKGRLMVLSWILSKVCATCPIFITQMTYLLRQNFSWFLKIFYVFWYFLLIRIVIIAVYFSIFSFQSFHLLGKFSLIAFCDHFRL